MITWDEVVKAADSRTLSILHGLWYHDKPLINEDKAVLEPLYQKYSMGEPNFKAWAKQRMRQLFENQVRKNASQNL